MYPSSGNYEAFARPRKPESVEKIMRRMPPTKSAREMSRAAFILSNVSALDQAAEYDHDGDDKEDMNETAHGVTADEAKHPKCE